MSYYDKVLKSHPVGFWLLDDSTSDAKDYSGCENLGTYSGSYPSQTKNMPLVIESSYSAKITSTSSIDLPITKNYYGNTSVPGFGTKYTADHEFTIECWAYIKVSSINTTPIIADTANNIGIFYKNKNIIFNLNSESLEYSIPEINRSVYIVCKYSSNTAYIYIDGKLVVNKKTSLNPFLNTTLSLSVGPTLSSGDEFLINNVAIYRHSLSEKTIQDHYLSNYNMPSIQIAYPDGGEVFNIYDNGISRAFSFTYPKNKEWEYFLTEGLYLNKLENQIEISKTDLSETKEIIIEDIITLPAGILMDSSKIEWSGSNGISVYTSLDGLSYEECKNGYSIPQYKYGLFSEQKFFYLKIILESSDSSKYLPTLKELSLNFYSEQIIYSKNGSSYISKITNNDFTFGKEIHPILSSNILNGIIVPENSGFNINTNNSIKSIELFYIPENLGQGSLIWDSDITKFRWNSAGIISKTNISSIYINGQDFTSGTDINNAIIPKYLNHIIINLGTGISGQIAFNYLGSSVPCTGATYQYITLYQEPLDYNKALNHYNLYTSKLKYSTSSASISVTENSVKLYNNDWRVLQNS